MGLQNNTEILSQTTEEIHIRSIEDLQKQGINTDGMELEGETIDKKTTWADIQKLKFELETAKNKGEIMKSFLTLEKQVASRAAVMNVEILKTTVDQEAVSEEDEKAVEQRLLDKAEKTLGGDAIEAIQQKAETVVADTKESLLSSSKAKIAAMWGITGFIGGFVFDMLAENESASESEKWILDGIFQSVLTSILGALGLTKVYDSYKDSLWKIGDTSAESSEIASWDNSSTWAEHQPEDSEDLKTKIEKKQDIYSAIGSTLFIQVSGERFPNKSDRTYFFEKIQNLPWGEVIGSYTEYLEVAQTSTDHNKVEIAYKKLIAVLGINDTSSTQRDVLLATLNSVAGPVPITLIQERISPEKIKQVIADQNLEKKFWKEFVQGIQGKTPREMNFKQISIIYTLLFPGIVSEKLEAGKNSIREFLFGEDAGNEFSAIVEDFKEKRNVLLSEETIQKILISGSPLSYVSDDTAFKDFLSETSEEQEITKLIAFKNDFLKNLFESQKYQLWGFDKFESKIRANTNYKDIISIYTFLNGNPDISNLDSLDSTGLYFWITKILDDDREYALQLISETFVENSPHFTDVEKSIIQKNFLRLGKTYLDIYFEAMEVMSDGIRVGLKKSIESNLDIQVTDEVLDTSEWVVIASILWVGGWTLFVPHPVVKILWVGIIAFGGNYAVSKLWDNGTFEKLETHMSQDNVYSLLDKILKEQFDGKGISDFAKGRESGADFESFVWS